MNYLYIYYLCFYFNYNLLNLNFKLIYQNPINFIKDFFYIFFFHIHFKMNPNFHFSNFFKKMTMQFPNLIVHFLFYFNSINKFKIFFLKYFNINFFLYPFLEFGFLQFKFRLSCNLLKGKKNSNQNFNFYY